MHKQDKPEQHTNESKKTLRWEFGNLLDADAQKEVREFYGALESSRNCKSVLVGFTPPRD